MYYIFRKRTIVAIISIQLFLGYDNIAKRYKWIDNSTDTFRGE